MHHSGRDLFMIFFWLYHCAGTAVALTYLVVCVEFLELTCQGDVGHQSFVGFFVLFHALKRTLVVQSLNADAI